MEPPVVRTQDGQIWIEQSHGGDDSGAVVLEAAQVPTLIEWLQEAATEVKNQAAVAR